MTQYLILQSDADTIMEGENTVGFTLNDGWHVVGTVEASGVRTAIRKHLSEAKNGSGGTFAAVPSRSFRPVTVKAETKTTLKFG